MNTLLGTIITALVTDENDKFYFVQKDGVTFALSKEEGEHAIGDMVTGFAYTDSKQKSDGYCPYQKRNFSLLQFMLHKCHTVSPSFS